MREKLIVSIVEKMMIYLKKAITQSLTSLRASPFTEKNGVTQRNDIAITQSYL
jgi:hypothetical protein